MRGSVSWRALLLGLTFAAGWGASLLQRPSSVPVAAAAPAPETPAPACSDSAAMEANENLVAQLREVRGRLALAEERRDAAEGKNAQMLAAAARTPVATPAEEWGRMANDGKLRVKTPCAAWHQHGSFSTHRPGHGWAFHQDGSSRTEKARRAELAGFSEEELDALGDVYRRAQERTWASIRASCERNDTYRQRVSARPSPPPAAVKIELCRAAVFDVEGDATRAGLARVMSLRAARATSERATSDVERVAFALTDARETLDDEMVRTFGRERATRALDHGVLCFDEAVFDLAAPPRDG